MMKMKARRPVKRESVRASQAATITASHDDDLGHEDWISDELAWLHHLMVTRNNPLYAWYAIHLCLANDRQMPDWCAAYLREAAERIVELIEACNRFPGHGKLRRRVVSPTQATGEVPMALGLARQGWSAFAEHKADVGKMKDAVVMKFQEIWAEGEGTPHDVLKSFESIRKKHNIEHVRQVRTRIKKGAEMLEPKPKIR